MAWSSASLRPRAAGWDVRRDDIRGLMWSNDWVVCSAKPRAAEAWRARSRRDNPASVVARLGYARRSFAGQRAEFAVAVGAAFERTTAREEMLVFAHGAGAGRAGPETDRDQEKRCGNLAHETPSRLTPYASQRPPALPWQIAESRGAESAAASVRGLSLARRSSGRLALRAAKPGAREPHDGLIERGEKAGAVARRERFWPAGDLAGAAQRIHQIAGGQRETDRVFGEGAPVRRDHLGAGFDAAARQRHVRGDDDIAGACALGDPVVRLIHAGADQDSFNKPIPRNCDRAVADDQDFQRHALARMALGDAIHLLLHRAGVGVDVEGDGFGQRVMNLRSIRVQPSDASRRRSQCQLFGLSGDSSIAASVMS